VSERVNIHDRIKFDDIEGVWTFVHFSYSERKRKAVGYLRFGHRGELKSVSFNVAHLPMDTYAKFILGGAHVKKWSCFILCS
jgi:hypothetical protein